MTTSTALGGTTSDPFAAFNAQSADAKKKAAASAVSEDQQITADRFLTLLVTQLKNQDPLNPMDNAQVTSQLAQLNTVQGINKLNTTVEGLDAQFVRMQALQGASIVGHDVLVEGNALRIESGTGVGAFELGSSADKVDVQILNSAGAVVQTVQMGKLPSGQHDFQWKAGSNIDTKGMQFRVVASNGGVSVNTTPLAYDRVNAVMTGTNGLTLDLENSGETTFTKVRKVG